MSEHPSPAAPASKLSLRQRTTQGVAWVAAQAAVTRGVMLVQQLVLAWLLAKSDFGMIGLAFTVTTLVNLVANPGIDAVLVQRMRRYRFWSTPAFWLGITMSALGSVVMIALAPVAAWAYSQPKLVGLIAVLAMALPIQALQIVPKAQLQMQMQFRALVLIGLLNSVLTAALTIAAAYLGLGAFSFVVPIPIAAAVVSTVSWWLTHPPIRLNLELSRWKYLFRNSATVGMTQLFNTFINQADYMALGLAGLPDASIGAYVFAFNIAIQPLRLLSGNIPVVLFPSLSHLSLEPEKQVRAMLRAMRLLMIVIVPVCIFQSVFAEPMFRLVFPPKWMDAVLPCKILTLGLMVNAACWPANSVLLAQGRFREQLWVAMAGAVVFVAVLGAVIGTNPSIVSIAAAVAFWHCLNSPINHLIAIHGAAPRGSFLRETGPPLLAGVVAAVPCIILQKYLPPTISGDLIAIAAGGLIFAAIYLLLVYLLVPASLHDFIQQVAPLWERFGHSKRSSATNVAPSDSGTT